MITVRLEDSEKGTWTIHAYNELTGIISPAWSNYLVKNTLLKENVFYNLIARDFEWTGPKRLDLYFPLNKKNIIKVIKSYYI